MNLANKNFQKIRLTVFTLLGLLFLISASCAEFEIPEKLTEPEKDIRKLQINFTTLSVPLGKTKELRLRHINEIDFDYVVVNNGKCFTLTDDKKGTIIVKAGNRICQETIKINLDMKEDQDRSSNEEKKENNLEEKIINLRAYHPKYMDIGEGLLIRYTNKYRWIWDDSGSGGAESANFSHPSENGEDGWYALGSHIRNQDAYVTTTKYTEKYPMIMVKDYNDKGLLARPSGYYKLFDDGGSGADGSGSLWLPQCRTGFRALGIVANKGHGKPSFDAVRCVKQSYVGQADMGKKVYNDKESGSRYNVEVREITLKKSPVINDPNKAPLLVGTFVTTDKPTKSITNFLLIPKLVANKSENEVQPELTGYKGYDGYAKFFSAVRLPFSMIKQLMQKPENIPDYIKDSPFIYLQRQERYKSLNSINNQTSSDVSLSYTTESSFSKTKTKEFTATVGLSVTAGGEAGFLGNGGSWEVSISAEFSWRNETAKTYGEAVSRELTVTVAPKKFVEVLQIYTDFQVLDEQGRRIGKSQPLTSGGDNFLTLQYPK